MIFNVASDVIVGIGAYRVWVHTFTISYSIYSLLNAADVDGGLCTATGTSKWPPPPHPHSLTRLCSDLDFWIQRVKTFKNSTSCFSTTSRHPLACLSFRSCPQFLWAAGSSEEEERILNHNEAVLHSDEKLCAFWSLITFLIDISRIHSWCPRVALNRVFDNFDRLEKIRRKVISLGLFSWLVPWRYEIVEIFSHSNKKVDYIVFLQRSNLKRSWRSVSSQRWPARIINLHFAYS